MSSDAHWHTVSNYWSCRSCGEQSKWSNRVHCRVCGAKAGGTGEIGLNHQALHPRKLTVKGTRRTTEPRIQSNRWSWLARPWRTQGSRVQRSSSSNKDTLKGKAKERDRQRNRQFTTVQNQIPSAAEALEQAESAKSRYEQFHVELAKVDAEVADACVAVQSEGVQATSAHQFLRIETHLHKLSEQQKGESRVSELLAAANTKPMDTDTGTRDTSSKGGAADLDEPKRLSNWRNGQHLLDLTSLSSTMTSEPGPCENCASWANTCARPNTNKAGAPTGGGDVTTEGSLAATVSCGNN